MLTQIARAVSLCCLGSFTLAALAQSGDASLVLGEVTVRGQEEGPLPTRRILSSVDVLAGENLESRNAKFAWELFNLVPGAQVTSFGQGNWGGKFSIRGFNGEGEINAVKLLIDGIPSNSNDGNMPYLDMVFAQDIDAIEVVRGTNDPRNGLHSIAGNANVITRIGGNDTRLRLGAGSFGSNELQLSKAIEQDGLSQNYFVATQHSNGQRDHSQADRSSFAGKWFYTPDSGSTRVGLIARHYESEAQEPGYLTAGENSNNPDQSLARNATDGGIRRMNQVSGHLETAINDRLYWTTRVYANEYTDKRWVRFSAAASQQERLTEENHYGFLSNLTYRPEVSWAHAVAIEGGVDAQWQENHSERYLTTNRVRTTTRWNQDFDFDIYGAYVQAVIQPTPQWKLIPGYRVDAIRGSYTNNLNGRTYDINDYGLINQPKFSVVYTPDPRYSLYGNAGRTFQVGVGTGSYKVGRSDNMEPSLNDGWELGLKLAPVAGVEGRVALWQQKASNEARRVLNGASNDSEYIGDTRRRGLDLQLSAKLGSQWRLWGGVAFQRAIITQAEAANPASQGKEVDHVPHRIYSLGADYQATPDLKLSLWANGQSSYYLERTNSTAKFGGYNLLNVSAAYQLRRDTTLEFQIKNLADRYYEYVWWYDNTVRDLHSRGDGRAAYATVNVKF